jgi:7-cyano-7-deazaguanine reductase
VSNKSNSLQELASKHLGKAGNGSIVAPYITPEKHDKTLLVPLPRSINRETSNTEGIEQISVGYEVWHAYEMSFIGTTGMPVTGILKVMYPSDSESIVESKSFKLYLNSFDLEMFDEISNVELLIRKDLSEVLKCDVNVKFHKASECNFLSPLCLEIGHYYNVDSEDFTIKSYTEDATVLLEDHYSDLIDEIGTTFSTANLRSNCEITNQKDTGNCYIYIKGEKEPTLKALTRYVISFRNSQHFHENATEIMFKTLYDLFQPEELVVVNLYNRRGGLDINSVRASSIKVLNKHMSGYVNGVLVNYANVNHLFEKTAQQ